jgi:hypothetical protein
MHLLMIWAILKRDWDWKKYVYLNIIFWFIIKVRLFSIFVSFSLFLLNGEFIIKNEEGEVYYFKNHHNNIIWYKVLVWFFFNRMMGAQKNYLIEKAWLKNHFDNSFGKSLFWDISNRKWYSIEIGWVILFFNYSNDWFKRINSKSNFIKTFPKLIEK